MDVSVKMWTSCMNTSLNALAIIYTTIEQENVIPVNLFEDQNIIVIVVTDK